MTKMLKRMKRREKKIVFRFMSRHNVNKSNSHHAHLFFCIFYILFSLASPIRFQQQQPQQHLSQCWYIFFSLISIFVWLFIFYLSLSAKQFKKKENRKKKKMRTEAKSKREKTFVEQWCLDQFLKAFWLKAETHIKL